MYLLDRMPHAQTFKCNRLEQEIKMLTQGGLGQGGGVGERSNKYTKHDRSGFTEQSGERYIF